jgi:hypothetical protein
MPSEYSPLLRLELIGPGEQSGLWGDTTNKNLGTLLEQAVAGVAVIPLVSAGIYEVQALDGTKDEARSSVLQFTGTPGGAVTIKIPSTTKLYVVRNSTNQTITVRTAAQISNPLLGGVELLTNEATLVFCDGTYAIVGIQTTNTSPILTVTKGGTGKGSFPTAGFVKTPGGTGDFTSSATVSATTEISGVLPIGSGGTGTILPPGAGQLLIGTSSGAYVPAALSAGTGISINNTSGGIQISTSGSAAGVNSIAGSNINVSPASGNVVISLTSTNVINALGYTPANGSSYAALSGATFTGSVQATSGAFFRALVNGPDYGGFETTYGSYSTFLSPTTVQVGIGGTGIVYSPGGAFDSGNGIGFIGFGGSIQYSSTNRMFTAAGECYKTGSGTAWIIWSDARIKKNVTQYTKGLTELNQIQIKNFEYNGLGNTVENEKGLGVIADEIQQVLPDSVKTISTKLNSEDAEKVDLKTFDNTELLYLLVNSVKELSAKVDAQAIEIAALKGAK